MELKPTIMEALCGESREEGKEGGRSFYHQQGVKAVAFLKRLIFSGGMRTPGGRSEELHLITKCLWATMHAWSVFYQLKCLKDDLSQAKRPPPPFWGNSSLSPAALKSTASLWMLSIERAFSNISFRIFCWQREIFTAFFFSYDSFVSLHRPFN